MNNETATRPIAPEMTLADAAKIAREEAAKHSGDVRSALTMLADTIYVTPKSAIDAVMANPPLSPEEPETSGEQPFTRMSLVNIPLLNVEFHPFYTDDYFKAVCYWENKEGERRVYELTVTQKPGDWVPGKWRAIAQVGSKVIFDLSGSSKSLVIECALAAMRRYLIRAHRAAWRTARRLAKQQAYNSKAAEPLSPEEELVDTIARQKETVA